MEKTRLNKWIKNFFKKTPPRLKLKMLYRVCTDKAVYIAYNTETTDYDAVNIQVEEQRNNKIKIILEEEIFDDSLGGLCGNSFSHLVHDSKSHLLNYIKDNNEFIVSENDC